MKHVFIIVCLTLLASCEMGQTKKTQEESNQKAENKTAEACTDNCCATGTDSTVLACKLTTPELQKRKATVLANLRKQVVKRTELPDGYAFTFKGTDEMLDELNEFIKTERQCCDFFTFNIAVAGNQSKTVLSITGPEGAKEFIISELEL